MPTDSGKNYFVSTGFEKRQESSSHEKHKSLPIIIFSH